ncbi:MAG: flagellar basal body M-ring protein FliF, partial [Dechloromonas sp.]
RKEAGKDGKPVTRPLAEAELKQINDLIREAMGFSRERGDTLSVANAPFTESEKQDISLPIWKDPESISYAKDIIKILIVAAIIALLYFKIIQPSLKTMFPPPESREGGAAGEGGGLYGPGGEPGEEGDDGATDVRIDTYAAKVQKARDIAQADPKAVANIIKDWMGSNAN